VGNKSKKQELNTGSEQWEQIMHFKIEVKKMSNTKPVNVTDAVYDILIGLVKRMKVLELFY